MTTETVKIPSKEELLEGNQEEVVEQPEYTEAEQRALDDGWVPKDQWKGPPDEWRPAKEFNDRGELFSRIKAQSKELAELKQATEFLTKQNKEQYLKGVEDTIKDLKAARNNALEAGDLVAAEELRDKIDEVKEQAAEAKVVKVATPAGPSQTFIGWHDKNDWYMKDEDMTAIADAKGKSFYQRNKGAPEADMLEYVTKEVRRVFPDKFPSKSPPSPNGSGRESPRGRSNEDASGKYKEAENSMNDTERGIMRTILKQTGMTKEEYLKQYAS